jgi:ABC-type transport system substrate-binding protein
VSSQGGELTPGSEFAGYRIESLLGRGGMSVVYLAHHLGLERKVAIKVLSPALAGDERFRDRFVRESRMAASLDHPNVIPIYEAGEADGRLFIAMRYVEGTDLKELIRESGPMAPVAALSILRQVAGGLDAAHERGLVHRDVKPANILIVGRAESEQGGGAPPGGGQATGGRSASAHAYLSDFGLTRRSSSDSGITGTGQFVGTLDYAAPEQFEGKSPDARTDVYALGCVLFEMLSGHPPYKAEFDAALMFAHLSEAPPKVTAERPDLPIAIDDVVATAMAKDPDDRYQSAGELAHAAFTALGFETGDVPVPSPSGAKRKPARKKLGPAAAAKPRRRRGAIVGAIAIAVIVALVAVLVPALLGGEEPKAEAGTPAGMAIISAKDGRQTGFIPLSSVRTPADALYAEGHFWVLNLNPISFVEIDPRNGHIVRQIASPTSDVGFYGVSGNTLYVTDFSKGVVYAVNVLSARNAEQFTIPGEDFGLGWPLVAFGSLWVGGRYGNLYRLDLQGRLQHRFGGLGGTTFAVAAAPDAIWTAGDEGMNRIDPDGNRVEHVDAAHSGGYIGVGGGFAWGADETKGVVYKVDDGGNLVDTYTTGEGARTVSYSDGTLWVGNQDAGTVTGIDAVTGAMRKYSFGHPLQAVAAGSGRVLVQMNEGRTYEDRIDALKGSVARLLVQGYQLDTADPALVWNTFAFEVEDATCAPLLGWSTTGTGAPTLEPETAASMPEVSADGRTYTFTVRPGFKFSPPSNQPVTAETYRFSIERALSPKLGDQPPASFFITDVEGLDAFRAGDVDHISGLKADGDTLSITLTEPSPDFLARLTLPFLCPVPTDSAVTEGGAVINLPGSAGQEMVPSAGPYYIADHFNGEYLILEKNPNYGGTRPQGFDAIALREGVDAGEAVGRVKDGSWDGIVNLYDPVLAPDGAVAEQFGAGGEGPEYIAAPDGWSFSLELNASRPLFADASVRRAVAYALDRPALARTQAQSSPSDGLLPSAQVLAPNLPGVPTDSPYPVDGPDLDKAKALMGGKTGTAVLAVSSGCQPCEASGKAIRADLEPIGITVQLKFVEDSFSAAQEHPEKFDMKVLGASPDFASTASYAVITFSEYIPKEWLPESVRTELTELRAAPAETREQEAAAFLAGPVSDEVPLVGIAYSVAAALLGPRLGCREFRPFIAGPDLAALCPADDGSGTSSPSA